MTTINEPSAKLEMQQRFKFDNYIEDLVLLFHGSSLLFLPQGTLPHRFQDMVGDQGSQRPDKTANKTIECEKSLFRKCLPHAKSNQVMGPVAVSEGGGAELGKNRGGVSGGGWSGE